MENKFSSGGRLPCTGQEKEGKKFIWLTPDTKLLMRERDRLKRIAAITNDHTKWDDYKKLKNQINHMIKASKKDHFMLSLMIIWVKLLPLRLLYS